MQRMMIYRLLLPFFFLFVNSNGFGHNVQKSNSAIYQNKNEVVFQNQFYESISQFVDNNEVANYMQEVVNVIQNHACDPIQFNDYITWSQSHEAGKHSIDIDSQEAKQVFHCGIHRITDIPTALPHEIVKLGHSKELLEKALYMMENKVVVQMALFHGSNPESLDNIARNGFDPNLARESRNAYFAAGARYSFEFGKDFRNDGKYYNVMMVFVLIDKNSHDSAASVQFSWDDDDQSNGNAEIIINISGSGVTIVPAYILTWKQPSEPVQSIRKIIE